MKRGRKAGPPGVDTLPSQRVPQKILKKSISLYYTAASGLLELFNEALNDIPFEVEGHPMDHLDPESRPWIADQSMVAVQVKIESNLAYSPSTTPLKRRITTDIKSGKTPSLWI